MPTWLPPAPQKITLLVLGLFLLPSPAFAGFEWVPPTDTSSSIISPAPVPQPSVQTWPQDSITPIAPPAPMATSSPEAITPIIIEGTPTASDQPVVTSVASTHDTLMTMHPLLPPSKTLSTTTTTTTSTSPAVVRGFAKQVPLAVALRQILPPGYGFSVDPDVDLGVLISFQGGKPWRATLSDALDPAGLVMREHGQMVSIGRVDGTPAASASRATIPTSTTTVAPHILEPPADAMPVLSSAPDAATSTISATEIWQAGRGDSLHKVIEAWAHRSGVELNWTAEYDYPLQASFNYSGSFEDAVRNLLSGFEEAHPQPVAELHSNTSLGQKVLIIQARGNNYSD